MLEFAVYNSRSEKARQGPSFPLADHNHLAAPFSPPGKPLPAEGLKWTDG